MWPGLPKSRGGHSSTILAKSGVRVTGAAFPGEDGGSDGQEGAGLESGRPGTQPSPCQASVTLSAPWSGRPLPFGFIWVMRGRKGLRRGGMLPFLIQENEAPGAGPRRDRLDLCAGRMRAGGGSCHRGLLGQSSQ